MDLIHCPDLQGQLHSVPSRGPHYGMQHSMQGLVVGYGLHLEAIWLNSLDP